MTQSRLFTREEFLIRQAIFMGAPWYLAIEAVSSVAIEHPEWDMKETRTWKEWVECQKEER